MLAKTFKWGSVFLIVSYVAVVGFLKVLKADRKRKIDPAFLEKLETAMLELDACKAANEELRAKIAEKAEKADVETQGPVSPSLEKPLR